MKSSHGQVYYYNGNEFHKEHFFTREFIQTGSIANFPSDKITWLNFYVLDDFEAIEAFCRQEHFDMLVTSMIREKDRRPQFEDYENYLFFSIRSAMPSAHGNLRIHQEQLSFVLGKNYLISFQSKPSDYFASVRDRLENKKGIIRDKGSDILLYRMLDAITDNYFEVMDTTSIAIEDLDARVSKVEDPSILTTIEFHKRNLMELRRIVLPLKEIATALESTKSPLLKRDSKHYFSDLKQNCISIIEEIESNKITLDGLSSLYYASQSQRMNEVMKVLTIVSTIFIPLTFIAGIYGMNFDNMPELQAKNGYYITWAVMIFITIALLFYFKHRGWLGRTKK